MPTDRGEPAPDDNELGEQVQQVGIVAVTVDPEQDTIDKLRHFSDERGLANQWFFETGSREAPPRADLAGVRDHLSTS